MTAITCHASAVVFGAGATAAVVLLQGPPGAGKSDVALRCLHGDARLLADDQVILERDGDAPTPRLLARCPPPLSGLIEVRGLGILQLPPSRWIAGAHPVRLAVALVAAADVPRMPEWQPCPALLAATGVAIPRILLAAADASTPEKLRLAVEVASGEMVRLT